MGISQQIGASSLIKPGVCTSTTRPASPFTGQCIFQTDTNQLLVWNGTAWVIPNSPAQNPTGLELVTSATITNSTSTTFSNCFSSTYDHYHIVWALYKATAGVTSLTLTFLNASNTAQTYAATSEKLVWNGNVGGAYVVGDSTAGAIVFNENALTEASRGLGMTYKLDVFYANSSTIKLSATGEGHYGDAGGGKTIGESIKWAMGNSASIQQTYGFKLTAGLGFSGTVSVYGYRK